MEKLKTFGSSLYAKVMFIVVSLFTSMHVFAQDAKLDVNVNSGGGGFMSSPWVWVVGAAVFILLLVALMRGGGKRD